VSDTYQRKKVNIRLRWFVRRDFPEILNIESKSFDFPWQENDFVITLRRRTCIGMVAETKEKEKVVGYMIYEFHKSRINMLNFAVHQNWRCRGVGCQMIGRMISKLSSQGYKRITTEIRETNLTGQIFLQKRGFKAINILHNYWDEGDEDAYVMEYSYKPKETQITNDFLLDEILDDLGY